MARRRLQSPLQWNGLLAPPVEEREIVRHYTLSRADLDLIAPKRTPHRRLGFALMLCYLRHPSRVLERYEEVPPPLLAFIADQVQARPEDMAQYRRRDPSRRPHLAEHCQLIPYYSKTRQFPLIWIAFFGLFRPVEAGIRKKIARIDVLVDYVDNACGAAAHNHQCPGQRAAP